ncbi:hypothetical protein VKS41_003776 [Umbelopsis sp. WA50703]
MVLTRVDNTTGESLDIPLSSIQHEKKPLSWRADTANDIIVPTLENLSLPIGRDPHPKWQEDALEAHEWIGLASLGSQRITISDRPDPFVSVYNTPEPRVNGSVSMMRSSGLIPPHYIEQLLVILRKTCSADQCWGALTVWGYKDSPLAWHGREHGYLTNGENDYTILLLCEKAGSERQPVVCYQATGAQGTL